MVDLLKEFFKKAPGELGAIVIIVCADLIFIYKIINLSVGYTGPLDLSFIVLFVQFLVFLIVLRLALISHHRILLNEHSVSRALFHSEYKDQTQQKKE